MPVMEQSRTERHSDFLSLSTSYHQQSDPSTRQATIIPNPPVKCYSIDSAKIPKIWTRAYRVSKEASIALSIHCVHQRTVIGVVAERRQFLVAVLYDQYQTKPISNQHTGSIPRNDHKRPITSSICCACSFEGETYLERDDDSLANF